ncbi:hypothetical protein [Silanimonas sp.]|uniref:hypothetical protein n=1 Tax=Silanimonas sp. TaxID=1929290 RepID=UPI0022C9FD9A|nr:hypothetical protein [Silanimonas sp.]MCZ8114969.1 hypothetical protein [Silanimonas sp.]
MRPRQWLLPAVLTLSLAACSSAPQASPSDLGALGRPATKLSPAFETCWEIKEAPEHRHDCVAEETVLQISRLQAADRDAETLYAANRLEIERRWRADWQKETDEACIARHSPNPVERLDGAYCLMVRTAQAAEDREVANALTRDAQPLTYGSVAAMCREEKPSAVLSTWARFPGVRRGRVPPSLLSTASPAEKAAQPDFDGFRIALIDNEWAYAKPGTDVGEWPAIEPVTSANDEGFVVEFDAPDAGGRSRYRIARVDDCWRMTGHDVIQQGERK